MKHNCPFTGIPSEVVENLGNIFKHILKNEVMGTYCFASAIAVYSPRNKYESIRHIIAGISRHHWEKYKTPFEITSGFLEGGYNDYDFPKNFKEKSFYLLKYIYENGGAEYREFTLYPENDYSLGFAIDSEEFVRLLTKLEDNGLIIVLDSQEAESGEVIVSSIRLSRDGIDEIEKGLPEFPMFDLAKQDVFTGDEKIDAMISHSKKLFFKHGATKEDKSSACETLCKVLEPIRDEMKDKEFFLKKDVDAFFQIVNEFDIRHNKGSTKKLLYEEQFDWVYYSLLNSIICFYKLNARLN